MVMMLEYVQAFLGLSQLQDNVWNLHDGYKSLVYFQLCKVKSNEGKYMVGYAGTGEAPRYVR